MWGFIRMRKLPICRQCGREIETDFCYQIDEEANWNTETLICENCRDKAIKKFAGTFLGDALEEWFNQKVEQTDKYVIESDVIETRFADLYT